MKRYIYKSDSEMGEVQAATLDEALAAAREESRVTDAAIADGGWCWVEDPDTGERAQVGVIDHGSLRERVAAATAGMS